jgi:uncharacterized protein (TIGR00730 family)
MKPATVKRIAVFCGSAAGSDNLFRQACTDLAGILYTRGVGIVYGGGNIGLMGILADEMLKLGGEVIGVIPQKLVDIEVAHTNLTFMHIVPGMHERKALMAKLSDAFLVLPGGIGTMEEFFEMYTWLQLGYHNKPVALLNVHGFYDSLIRFLEHMVHEGFLKRDRFEDLLIDDELSNLIGRIIRS